jgi:hypothetical protein
MIRCERIPLVWATAKMLVLFPLSHQQVPGWAIDLVFSGLVALNRVLWSPDAKMLPGLIYREPCFDKVLPC